MQHRKYIYKEFKLGPLEFSKFFLPEELEKLPYVDSSFFIYEYFINGKTFGFKEREIKQYCFNELQIVFSKILRRFLETPNESLQKVIQKQLIWFSIFKEIVLNSRLPKEVKFQKFNGSFEQLIISLYGELLQLRAEASPALQGVKVNIPAQFSYSSFASYGWQYSILDFLQSQVKKNLSDSVESFLIHGSFATKDFNKFSDLDALVILKDKIFRSGENLRKAKDELMKLSLFCYKIDPLAHHRFYYFTNFDLQYYPSFLFPPVLFDYSLQIFGKSDLELEIRNDKYQKIQIMSRFVQYFRDKVKSENHSKNKYQWKNDLSHIMLWPSFLLQAKGEYCYKKDSFKKARGLFSDLDFLAVDKASKVREGWTTKNLLKHYPNSFFWLLPHSFNSRMVALLRRRSIRQTPEESQTAIKTLTKDFLTFAENSLNTVLKNL